MNWAIYKWGARVVALWLMALVVALCASRSAAAVTVHLDGKDASSTVLLHVGDRLRIDLPAAPASAFRWKAKALDASHLEVLGRNTRLDSDRFDASGVQVFVWKAISPGQANIGLEYSRASDDKTIPPAKRAAIQVEVAAGELVPSANGDTAGEEPIRTATYRGTLPCDGCTGIAVDLALFTAGKGEERIFVERRRYQGAPGGDRTIAGTGKLVMVKGTYADPSMTVYALAAADGGLENFKVDGDVLIPLDGQMLPIPATSGSSPAQDKGLKKVPDDAESGASAP